MNHEDTTNRLFGEIVALTEFDPTSIEQKMLNAAGEAALTMAVYDELGACMGSLFLTSDEQDARCVQARAHVADVAAALQHEYGLSDDDTLKVVEMARTNLKAEY